MTEQEFLKLIECLDNIIDMKIENALIEHVAQYHSVKETDEIREDVAEGAKHLRDVVDFEND